jgi:hypothetical protein
MCVCGCGVYMCVCVCVCVCVVFTCVCVYVTVCVCLCSYLCVLRASGIRTVGEWTFVQCQIADRPGRMSCQMFVTPIRYKYRATQNFPCTAIVNSIRLQHLQLLHSDKHIFTWFPLFALGGQSFVRKHDVTIACPRSWVNCLLLYHVTQRVGGNYSSWHRCRTQYHVVQQFRRLRGRLE